VQAVKSCVHHPTAQLLKANEMLQMMNDSDRYCTGNFCLGSTKGNVLFIYFPSEDECKS
jgi:hypothetical protein